MQSTAYHDGLVIGVDIGSQGVRVVIADAQGQVAAQASQPFTWYQMAAASGSERVEQAPQQWWDAAQICLRQATSQLDLFQDTYKGLAITGTSGTLCLLDSAGTPTYPAIMYSDRRAGDEAAYLNTHCTGLTTSHGYQFQPSFALPKLLWIQRHHPEVLAKTRYIAHAGDVLVGRLTGVYGVSDWSQALKTGYDLIQLQWDPVVATMLHVPIERFPQIVSPGTVIGYVTPAAAAATGLPAGLAVVAGMTDGCAAQIAGGASAPGQWMSVLGTTLVFKGVTTDLLCDPQGRIYSHRHPQGMWLPGAASNTGGEVLALEFAGADLAAMDAQAIQQAPSGVLYYPLQRKGERFPFANAAAQRFLIGEPTNDAAYYTACLEGVGYIERLAYDTLAQLGAKQDGELRVTGGGARSHTWLQIRANILHCPLLIPEQTEAAFGAAVLAAGTVLHSDLMAATRAMVHIRQRVEPQGQAIVGTYAALYEQFVAACRDRGLVG